MRFDEHVPEIQVLLTPQFCSCLPTLEQTFQM